ncbi:MAG: hypothetical protein FIB06_01565 [Betaproteobacteria bacterium]|nr:hypothetical protein [Betaproteobacteria bacterium]
MTLNQLAESLGLSLSTIKKHKKRGMPTNSVEAAAEWRDRHLSTLSRKEYRIDGNPGKSDTLPPAARMAPRELPLDEVAICAHVPFNFFRPLVIASCAADAGMFLTGAEAVKLAGCLLHGYMVTFDQGDELLFRCPPDLLNRPGSPEAEAVISEVDEWLRQVITTHH